jgi:molecular chaperone GrpE
MHKSKKEPQLEALLAERDGDDEIEIIEVVGLEEDSPAHASGGEGEGAEIVVDFEGRRREEPGASGQAVKDSERLLRMKADFENFKKRVERERLASERHAAAGLVKRLLSVLDNFERALARDVPEGDGHSFREGIEMIFRQLLDELRKEGLKPVDSLGQPFDPNVHEAVATDNIKGLPSQTVVEELRRGYLLNDRLLRASLVKVCVCEKDAVADAGTGEEE